MNGAGMRDPTCPECSVTMERGFTLDRSHNSMGRAGQWVSGEPERSFWFGIKLRGRRRLVMVAFRCPRCGRLEFRAPETADR
jgi:hypothetical protein